MIYMFLAHGFEETEALCPLDILRRAGLEVTTVGVSGEMIRGAHGIVVEADMPDTHYRDPRPDMLILPGGMPGTKNLDASKIVDAALKAADRSDAYVAAICAAPMVLGKRGMLDGREAVCYPGFEEYLEGAKIPEDGRKVVVDGKFVTAKGMGVALEFGLTLVSLLKGPEEAEKIRHSVIAD